MSGSARITAEPVCGAGRGPLRAPWLVLACLPAFLVQCGCRMPRPVGVEPAPAARTLAEPAADGIGAGARVSVEGLITPVSAEVAEAEVPDAPRSPPLEDDCVRAIDLPTALALAGADNPTIALAFEAIRAADSERLSADALALPTLRAGADFNLHRGNLLSTSGRILNVDRQSAYAGLGAYAVGSGTVVVPGVRVLTQVADAWFDPRIARQRLAEARFEALATNNAVLLDVAEGYFELLGAQTAYEALRSVQDELEALARQTANFARTGQGRQADADRAASALQLVNVRIDNATEQVAVAAARLARLLHVDPSMRLKASSPLVVVQMVPPAEKLGELLQAAVVARPEVGARSAAIGAAGTRVRKEVVRPFVPLLSAGYSVGRFGGGSDITDPHFGNFATRNDFDAYAVWSLDNLGLGNLALQRRRRAELEEAQALRIQELDRVRKQVAVAYADVAAQRLQLEAARRGLHSAEEGYRLDAIRSRNLEGLPIELLNSIDLLADALLDVIHAMTQHNQAQFRLFVAIGRTPVAGPATPGPVPPAELPIPRGLPVPPAPGPAAKEP